MSEFFLNSLPLKDLIRLHNVALEKLLELSKFPYNKFEFAAKGNEVELIQKIISAKRIASKLFDGI